MAAMCISISAGNAGGSHYQVMHMPGVKADFRAVNCTNLKPNEIRHHIDQVSFTLLCTLIHIVSRVLKRRATPNSRLIVHRCSVLVC